MNGNEATLWRCCRCGKWSHAARKPKQHKRFVVEAEEGDRVLEAVPAAYGFDGPLDDGGYWIACGPFETWSATKAAVAA